jgi:hypothetical protein
MNLQDWLNNGWLSKHQTSPQEINNLLRVAERDLKDCLSKGLSADWRLNIAYNAALQSSAAALAAAGYRTSRDSHPYRVIQSLSQTIGADIKLVVQFDRFRKKRNIGGYEMAGIVSDQEADEMIELARQIKKQVELWLEDKYPEFLK